MKRIAVIITLLAFIVPTMRSVSFLDAGDPEQFFTLGARIGINTSNRSFPNVSTTLYNSNSWGTGFDFGVLANLNIKNYLTIQPGLFFDSRSGNYSYLFWYHDYLDQYQEHWDMGHTKTYSFTVPVMAVVKFDILEKVVPMAEFGPYIQIALKHTGNITEVPYQLPQSTSFSSYMAEHKNFDFGFKMGAGLQILQHYYIGVHYLAGACNAWKVPSGGRNKQWLFTIGYDL